MAVTFKDGVILGTNSIPLLTSFSTKCLHEQPSKLTVFLALFLRRRLPNHHRRIHRQPSDRQADPRPRHHLVLPLRLRRRHTGRCRYRPVSAGPVPHVEWEAAIHTDRCLHLPGDVLLEQGHVEVSEHCCCRPKRGGDSGSGPSILYGPTSFGSGFSRLVLSVVRSQLTRTLFTAPDSSSLAGMSATAARSTVSRSAARYTRDHTLLAVPAPPTSTVTATRTGRRAWRRQMLSISSRAR